MPSHNDEIFVKCFNWKTLLTGFSKTGHCRLLADSAVRGINNVRPIPVKLQENPAVIENDQVEND